MAFDNTPNRLESAFIQRSDGNTFYEQVNISGSNLIVYHGSDGKLTADRISVWAALYDIGIGGLTLSSSWASSSFSSSYASTSSYVQVINLPVYANNSAAIAGGLPVGAFYRTGADPDVVCVVH